MPHDDLMNTSIDVRKLRNHRINAGHTCHSLSLAAGLAPMHVRHIEAGDRQPRPATIKAIADVLGCSVMDLLTEEAAA